MSVPRRCLLGCPPEQTTLFNIPATPAIRACWFEFLHFDERGLTKRDRVCARHFTESSFTNYGQYSAGLAKDLILKDTAVPKVYTVGTQSSKIPTRDVACQYSPTQRDVFIQTSKSSIPTKGSTHSKASHSVAVGCSMAEFTELGLTSRPIRSKRKRVQLEELSTESNNGRENTDDAFKSRRCSVVGCDSWHRGAQCFSLAADPDKRLEWVQFLFVVNGQRIQESSWVDIRVCAEHFTPSCFVQVNPATSIALLKTDAIPSVYRPADPEVKEMTSADEIDPVLKKVQMMDESSEPDQHRDSDDNWEPEDESLILDSDDSWEPEDESLILDSDEDYISSDEDTDDSAPKHKELCTECGKLFKTRRPHICDYKIKPFPCNICGKRCVSEQALAIHSNIHNPNHQFLCKFCLAGFKTKTNKNNHEQIHSGEERPYKCPHCSEMFDTFKNRQVHMKDHPERGLLKCHICGMEFSYFNVFQRHLLVHTREKPFKCSVCDRGFNQSGHLKSHMRMHTGERPYKCQHCNRGFNHNVSLKSHLKRFHTESENQKKTANLGGSVGGDPEGERGTDSLNDIVQDDHTAEEEVWTGGGGFRKRTTGRPIGRPKKKIKDTTVEEEKQQRQDKNTDTAKRRNRKPRKRQYSSEDDEEELCEIE
ncbi:uncharacterized protein LOC119786135 isoform X2 [Cyprinodon tularosa]|uniref:uncharacterized protein LOC119786135 isoform X2 n=1 Tax=Cyprinodon tularosa TaxID=77115 RepID=UPI0018E1E106|nr:uncharacterized protein LOC119786135 isoform X2 [Cyprinodon tularosa]